ncbi:glutamate--tRNA ligase [candidate division KSB1 bacterium]|nr:glutamate--tRNA ligase [candidate division KSB1 bacterium]
MTQSTINPEVRVRSAPSPTGDPHLGTAYNALFNYVFARAHHGKFVLRIEDTDRERSNQRSEAMILSALKWLGLQWDEGPDVGGPYGPYRQSERSEHYQLAAQQLLDSGHAYRCFCTKERLAELRLAQQTAKTSPGYDGFCRSLTPETVQQNLNQGLPHVVRLKLPQDGQTIFHDELRGDIVFENKQLQDQILMKADGFPTYHLANVVDDHLMKISHVIRAEEWISSTPLHAQLYSAFGWQPPQFIHLPLLRNLDKSKMSKRKNPVSITYYQRQGFLPEALLNFLALQGWSLPSGEENFTLTEMIEHFSIDRISLGGPVFDLKKLRRFNGIYIRKFTPAALSQRLHEFSLQRQIARMTDATFLEHTTTLLQPRLELLSDFETKAHFLFRGHLDYNVRELVPKGKNLNQTLKAIFMTMEKYQQAPEWTVATLDQITRALAEELNWTSKEFFMCLRIILTGSTESPPLFETMEILGQTECVARLQDGSAALMLG